MISILVDLATFRCFNYVESPWIRYVYVISSFNALFELTCYLPLSGTVKDA